MLLFLGASAKVPGATSASTTATTGNLSIRLNGNKRGKACKKTQQNRSENVI